MKKLTALLLACTAFITACSSTPRGIEPVQNFDLDSYLGTWYEIARIDHHFEKDLTQVSANYKKLPDGEVRVTNRGFDEEDQEWQQASANATFAKDENTGQFDVSFTGASLFSSSYVVFYLEPDYSVALVTSHNHKYFWLLSRDRFMPQSEVTKYLDIAKQNGFDTEDLVYPQVVSPEDEEEQIIEDIMHDE